MVDTSPVMDLKYAPFQSVVDNSFWHKLSELKLDVDRLQENIRDVWGWFLHPNINALLVDWGSFNSEAEQKLCSSKFTSMKYLCQPTSSFTFPLLLCKGSYLNFNSVDAFKLCDKTKILEESGCIIGDSITSGDCLENPNSLIRFHLLTYADLKAHEFYYWFAFPASYSFSAQPVQEPQNISSIFSNPMLDSLLEKHAELSLKDQAIFGITTKGDGIALLTLKSYVSILNSDNGDDIFLGFMDPSLDPVHPGWPLRNILAAVMYHWKSSADVTIKVICFRLGQKFHESPVLHLKLSGGDDKSLKKWVGWERNERGKLGPRLVSLKDSMDPARLADSSAELNLKLMKWRLVPSLDLEIVSKQRCLLLGAGTLGCALARTLIAWGVRNIKFVDSGKVSYSNPVRQSLFTIHDVSKSKAKAAAAALCEILPSVVSEGIELSVPMPGHSTQQDDQKNCEKLTALIQEADAIFLVTDSRESRWLPTVLSTAQGKLCMTVALGFDSYLVMRHGLQGQPQRLGCYFCNDITAPGNSKVDRTLDQQCTVTRPGVSAIAASLAVELFVSLLQHSERFNVGSKEESLLGEVPHSIRGFLSSYSQVMPSTPAFPSCIACSDVVVNTFKSESWQFLSKVFNSADYLEEITGLKELQSQTDSIDQWGLSDDSSEGP